MKTEHPDTLRLEIAKQFINTCTDLKARLGDHIDHMTVGAWAQEYLGQMALMDHVRLLPGDAILPRFQGGVIEPLLRLCAAHNAVLDLASSDVCLYINRANPYTDEDVKRFDELWATVKTMFPDAHRNDAATIAL